MQLRPLVILFALWAAPAASLAIAAERDAQLWLQKHRGAPNSDELAELKTENPSAYALVKALLTKRSLGLLNPRHPTASFSEPAAEPESVDSGPEKYYKLASPGELSAPRAPRMSTAEVSLPYAEVQPAARRDWLSWKPQQSAMDDETMVQNVLGAVAELKGGKKAGLLSKQHQTDENPLVADEDVLATHADPAPAPMKETVPAAPKSKASPYMDFSMMTAPSAAAEEAPVAKSEVAPVRENSYLKGIDLSADMPKSLRTARVAKESTAPSNNYLASFSWSDDANPQPAVKQVAPKPAEPKVETKDSSLFSWLGVVKKQAPPARAQPAAPAKPSNPYLMDLSSF